MHGKVTEESAPRETGKAGFHSRCSSCYLSAHADTNILWYVTHWRRRALLRTLYRTLKFSTQPGNIVQGCPEGTFLRNPRQSSHQFPSLMSQQGTSTSQSLDRDGRWVKSEEQSDFPRPAQCRGTCSPCSAWLLCGAVVGLSGLELTLPTAALSAVLCICSWHRADNTSVFWLLLSSVPRVSNLSFNCSLKDR